MSDRTARLNLPLIQTAQAQKHITHNEALLLLDSIAQMVLVTTDAISPPAGAQAGDGYALGVGATGAWAAQDGMLAFWHNDGWAFVAPQAGWRAWDLSTGQLTAYTASGWQGIGQELQNLDGIGIGTTSDATNRLAVVSEATLFNHDGEGHQLKLNKSAAGDTTSLLYQSGFTGHAEMGLTGDNDFHVKISPDGVTWTEAFVVDATSGHVTGSAVQASATDTTTGRLARADWTYGAGNLIGAVSEVGGLPTGAVFERGANANGEYVRFADGTQICSTDSATFIQETSDALLFTWTPPADFLVGSTRTTSYCIGNSAADWIDIMPMDLGILRQFPTSDSMRITRNAGAPNFPSTGEIRNARIVTWGRWY